MGTQVARAADRLSGKQPKPDQIKTWVTGFSILALGATGHEIADTDLRELLRQVAAGTITAEETIAHGVDHVDAR